MKEFRNKVVNAAKQAYDVAKNADADDMAHVKRTLDDADRANRDEYKAKKAPGSQMTDAAFGRKAAEANQRYRDAAGMAIQSAARNKKEQ